MVSIELNTLELALVLFVYLAFIALNGFVISFVCYVRFDDVNRRLENIESLLEDCGSECECDEEACECIEEGDDEGDNESDDETDDETDATDESDDETDESGDESGDETDATDETDESSETDEGNDEVTGIDEIKELQCQCVDCDKNELKTTTAASDEEVVASWILQLRQIAKETKERNEQRRNLMNIIFDTMKSEAKVNEHEAAL